MNGTPKEVVRSFWESYNELNMDNSFEKYISPKLVNHAFGGAYDREAWLEVEKGFIEAFDDLHAEIVVQVTENDTTATYVNFSGTQTKEFYGVPAAGNNGTLRAMFFDRVEGGQIVEHWAQADVAGFLQEISGAATSFVP